VEIGEYDVRVTKVDPRRILHLHFKRHSRTAGESSSSTDLDP
jgi:hypothetical protein